MSSFVPPSRSSQSAICNLQSAICNLFSFLAFFLRAVLVSPPDPAREIQGIDDELALIRDAKVLIAERERFLRHRRAQFLRHPLLINFQSAICNLKSEIPESSHV